MNTFVGLDLMARGGTIALLAVLAWILIRDQRHEITARIAVAMLFAIMCHLVADMFPWRNDSGFVLFALKLTQSTAPTWFWLFSKTWFDDERRISRLSIAIVAATVLFGSLFLLLPRILPSQAMAIDVAQRLMWLSFAFAGLWIAWRGRADDLVESRRRLRMQFVFAVGLYAIIIVISGLIANLEPGRGLGFMLIGLGVPMITAALCITLFGLRQTDLFAISTTETKFLLVDDPAQDQLAARLQAYMENEKAWRDDALSIAKLAAHLGEQEYRLRRLINGRLGHRNFAAFLNGYRLVEVKQALTDPAQSEVSILTIALDAGFGSLAPFNRAFRDETGMTPTAYRQRPH
jgi:AraC-like DNA-binding protein